MYSVVRSGFLCKGYHIRIVSIDEYANLCRFVWIFGAEGNWEESRGPEYAILRSPRMLWVTVQSMDQYDIYFSLGMCIDFGDFEAIDFIGVYSGSILPEHQISRRSPRSLLVPYRRGE